MNFTEPEGGFETMKMLVDHVMKCFQDTRVSQRARLQQLLKAQQEAKGKPNYKGNMWRNLPFMGVQIASDLHALNICEVRGKQDCPTALGSFEGLLAVKKHEDKEATVAHLAAELGREGH